MNSLQFRLPGARVLDLFAGSGSLGFEALSRGAETCVFVESARSVVKLIEENARTLTCTDRIKALETEVLHGLHTIVARGPYDIIFCDPPYAEGCEPLLLASLPFHSLLTPDGVFSLEWGRKKSVVDEVPDSIPLPGDPAGRFLKKKREKIYGDSILTNYYLSAVEAESPANPESEVDSHA